MKMSVSLSLFFSFFLVIHNTNAFNITEILSEYPDYSTFNSYLSETNLADVINRRQTITILAVENSNLSPISGQTSEALKNILSVHVILDYFDVARLQRVSARSSILTTLFQTTGAARGQQGFLNVTRLSTGTIAFGSAVPGSNLGSNLIRPVASQPYNISVLQVSNVIIPQGIDGSRTSPPPAKAPSISPRVPPRTSPPRPSRAPAPKAVTPAAAPGSPPIPDAPVADAPTADAPAAEDAPAADTEKGKSPNAGTALDIGLALVFTAVLSHFYLASRI